MVTRLDFIWLSSVYTISFTGNWSCSIYQPQLVKGMSYFIEMSTSNSGGLLSNYYVRMPYRSLMPKYFDSGTFCSYLYSAAIWWKLPITNLVEIFYLFSEKFNYIAATVVPKPYLKFSPDLMDFLTMTNFSAKWVVRGPKSIVKWVSLWVLVWDEVSTRYSIYLTRLAKKFPSLLHILCSEAEGYQSAASIALPEFSI